MKKMEKNELPVVRYYYKWHCPFCNHDFYEAEPLPRTNCCVCEKEVEPIVYLIHTEEVPAILICLMEHETSLADLCPGLTEQEAQDSLWKFLTDRDIETDPLTPMVYVKIENPLDREACNEEVAQLLKCKPIVLVGTWSTQLLEILWPLYIKGLTGPKSKILPPIIAPVQARDSKNKPVFVRWAMVI